MGYRLRRELREALGPQITGLQRLIALEIADDANDHTRVSRATLEDLARWTGAKDGGGVRTTLKRLARQGWELRVPLGKGADGRVLFAVPGKALVFRVPEGPEGGTVVLPCAAEGGTVVPSVGTVVPSVGTVVPSVGTVVPPLSSSPHPSSLSAQARIVRAVAAVAEAEERELIDWITRTHKPRGVAWWRAVARNGDLAVLAEQWRAAIHTAAEGPLAARPALTECVKCRDPISGAPAPDGLCRPCRMEVPA